MGRKPTKNLERAKVLAAQQDSKNNGKAGPKAPSPEEETALSASFSEIHISSPPENVAEDPGTDPEDLPLEDPEPEPVDKHAEELFVDYRSVEPPIPDPNEPGGEKEDYAVRVDNQPIPIEEQVGMVKALDEIVTASFKGHGKTRHSTFDELTLGRIRLMLATLRLGIKLKTGLMAASDLAAAAFGRTEWAARTTHAWIVTFWQTAQLPPNIYGTWNELIIEDEDLQEAIKTHLRSIGRYAAPKDIITFFSLPVGEEFLRLLDEPICIRTAQRWMWALGWRWGTERRAQYADGHERKDVVDF
ncbi:hypothetical protein FRC07_013323 [Ceratobasidium sp. 392]|nr:hypothetical protein FRC07_013323 [Ceratobasidium sp. 392]